MSQNGNQSREHNQTHEQSNTPEQEHTLALQNQLQDIQGLIQGQTQSSPQYRYTNENNNDTENQQNFEFLQNVGNTPNIRQQNNSPIGSSLAPTDVQLIVQAVIQGLNKHTHTNSPAQQFSYNVPQMQAPTPSQTMVPQGPGSQSSPSQTIPLPGYNMEEYKGKTYHTEFLAYLRKQENFLNTINITDQQRKLLLNSRLPSTASTSASFMVYSITYTFGQYVCWLRDNLGPSQEVIREQLQQACIHRYETYSIYINRLYELGTYTGIHDIALIYILDSKLPKHLTSSITKRASFQEYLQDVQNIQKGGIFETIDDQFRASPKFLKFCKDAKFEKKPEKKGNDKDKPQEGLNATFSQLQKKPVGDDTCNTQTTQNISGIKTSDVKSLGTGVVSIQDFNKNQVLTYAEQQNLQGPASGTRQAKRQHVEAQQNQREAPQRQGAENPFEPTAVPNLNQGTSRQHAQQNLQDTQDQLNFTIGQGNKNTKSDAVQKLLEKLAQVPEDDKNKGKRGKVLQPKDNLEKKNHFFTADPNYYVNEQGQINVNQFMKDFCLPVPFTTFLQLIGQQIVPKADQTILKNAAYINNTTFDNTNFQGKQVITPEVFQEPNIQQTKAYNQDADQQSQAIQDNSELDTIAATLQSFLQISNTAQQNQTKQTQILSQLNSLSNFQACMNNVQSKDHYYIKVGIKDSNTEIMGILDPGAQNSIISLQSVQRNGIEHLVSRQPSDTRGVWITGCTGQERMYGIIPRLMVIIEGEEVLWDNLIVQQNTTFDLLIGLDIHHLFQIQMCFKTRRATFVPYDGDERKSLTIYNPEKKKSLQTQVSHLQVCISYVSQDYTTGDVIDYMQQIQLLYPGFPIYNQYQLILMDPPWYYNSTMFGKMSRPPYKCLTYDELKLLPIQSIADPKGSIILIWSTGTHLYQCLNLLTHWHFKYINLLFVWKKVCKNGKDQTGLGLDTRKNYEYLIMGTKGKVGQFRQQRPQSNVVLQSLVTIDTEEIAHQRDKSFFSRKPKIIYQKIQSVFNLEIMKNIEIFATQRCDENKHYDLYGDNLTPVFQYQTKFEDFKFQNDIIQNGEQCLKYSKDIAIVKAFVTSKNEIQEYCENLSIGQNISFDVQESLKQLIIKYSSIFKFTNTLTYTNLGEVDIKLKPHSKPVRMKPYKVVGEAYQFLRNKFDELEKCGMITKGASEWGTAVMCVPKDSPTEKFRAVQNFKRVNQLIEKDKYPLRLIDSILINLSNQKYFCVLDMRGGFNQVKRANSSRHIMAMILPFGQYIPNVMFFGETNAPSVFQRLVDQAIGDLYGHGVECYIDDIVVYGDTEDIVLERLYQLFLRLERSNFKLHPEKCTFFVEKANILGHEVCGSSISPKQKKITKLLNLKAPASTKQLQQFMGSINYYRKFIPNLSTLFLPLQKSLTHQGKFLWQSEQAKSYEIITQFLKEKLVLRIPDQSKQFTVLIYYSNVTYAAALLQTEHEGDFVVAFQSQMNIQTKPSALQPYIREIDCMVWAINQWRYLLQHQVFKVKANYQALKYLFETKTQNLQILNYQLELQDLVFEIEQIPQSRLNSLLLQTFLNKKPGQIEFIQQTMESLSNQQVMKKEKQIVAGSSYNKFELILQFDGASQTAQYKQQMGAGAFVLLNNKAHVIYKEALIFPGAQTNNCAEYAALIGGLKYLIKNDLQKQKILIQGDSQLVIRQITYIYMCNSENLNKLCDEARLLLKKFSNVTIEHIDRSFNKICDSLAKTTLTNEIKKHNNTVQTYVANLNRDIDEIYCQVCLKTQPEESMLLCDHCNQGWHYQCINLEAIPNGDWYCDSCSQYIYERLERNQDIDPVEDLELISFLRGEKQLEELNDKAKIRVQKRVQLYLLLNDTLFRVSVNGLREVPSVGERIKLIEQIHQLVGHLGMNRTLALIKDNYYWPRMNEDVENILRQCVLCQAQRPQYLNMPSVYPISKLFKPMQCLFIDCIYLPKTKSGYSLAIIAICGMSKWVESKPMRSNNSQETSNFLFDEIICRYGCPQVVRTDRGVEFMGNFKKLCERLGIIHVFSSPYYPQANGQVERVNQTIKNGLVKLSNSLLDFEYEWDDLLPQIMMGIRFTIARPTKYSPFQLLYGQDPVIPGFSSIQKQLTLEFPSEQEQEEFMLEKLKLKQTIQQHVHQNLREMEVEIDETIRGREKISPSNLEFGNLVFLKREIVKYPQTRSKGPYLFVKYGNNERTTAILVNLVNSQILTVQITKISPCKIV